MDAPANSIAVLPFGDVGSSTNDRFFTDGLHEDLITRLYRLSAKEIFAEELRVTDPPPSHVAARLAMFPELLHGGDYDALLERPTTAPDGSCTCYEARAWMHTRGGRAEVATALWDFSAVERLSVTEWPDALAEALDHASTATTLARAGRGAAAREQLEALSALGPEVLGAGAIRREDWRDIRVVRAEAYAALPDAAAAAQILADLLAQPSGVPREYLRERLAWP